MKNARTRHFEEKGLADLVEFVQAHPRLEMTDEYRRVAIRNEYGTIMKSVRVTRLAQARDFRAALLGFIALKDSGAIYNHDDPRKGGRR